MANISIYGGLFLVAFLAATLLPLQSEAVLIGLISLKTQPIILLLVTASIGNILGACVNWYLGRFIHKFADKPWFPISPKTLNKAEKWYLKYGKWSLLMSWLPIVGDPLTMIAGILKEPFKPFLILVSIAKITRYGMLALATYWTVY